MSLNRVYSKSNRKLKKMKQAILILIILIVFQTGNSQTLIRVVESQKPDFCDSLLQTENLIGSYVKIWHEGGIYSTLNESKNFPFPSKKIKKLCGRSAWNNFHPKTGDIGEVVFISEYEPGAVRSGKRTYILKIKNNYVGIACGYLTDTTMLDNEQEFEEYHKSEEERLRIYANGCEFKTSNINNHWNRAGLFNIDITSETYACALKETGVDTILLAKYIFDNGSIPSEKAFVLWQKNDSMYMKSYYNNQNHLPSENEKIKFEWLNIKEFFLINQLDSISSRPKPKFYMSHDMGLSIQVYIRGKRFFNERLPNYYWKSDEKHIKSIFWKMVYKKLIEK